MIKRQKEYKEFLENNFLPTRFFNILEMMDALETKVSFRQELD